MALKRLTKEYNEIKEKASIDGDVRPNSSKDLFNWSGYVLGP